MELNEEKFMKHTLEFDRDEEYNAGVLVTIWKNGVSLGMHGPFKTKQQASR